MGSNVFGTPITEEMLKAMPEYHDKKVISRIDKATIALEMKNAEGKDINALKFLESLRNSFGKVCTMCLVYNATGETVTFVTARDWKGRVCESPYPVMIANGQWGAFLHGQRYGGEEASRAGFVYSGKNNQGEEKHWYMGFYNSVHITNNRVYTEIHEVGHFDHPNSAPGAWYCLDKYLEEDRLVHQANQRGGLVFGSIGNITNPSPVFEAIMTLPEAVRG